MRTVRARFGLRLVASPNRTKLEPLGRGDDGFIHTHLIGSSPVWGRLQRHAISNTLSPDWTEFEPYGGTIKVFKQFKGGLT